MFKYFDVFWRAEPLRRRGETAGATSFEYYVPETVGETYVMSEGWATAKLSRTSFAQVFPAFTAVKSHKFKIHSQAYDDKNDKVDKLNSVDDS